MLLRRFRKGGNAHDTFAACPRIGWTAARAALLRLHRSIIAGGREPVPPDETPEILLIGRPAPTLPGGCPSGSPAPAGGGARPRRPSSTRRARASGGSLSGRCARSMPAVSTGCRGSRSWRASASATTLDVAEAHRRGIVVTNTPDGSPTRVADLAWASSSPPSAAFAGDRYLRAGRWREGSFPLTTSLMGTPGRHPRPRADRAGHRSAARRIRRVDRPIMAGGRRRTWPTPIRQPARAGEGG